jgi:kynurenine formamidase
MKNYQRNSEEDGKLKFEKTFPYFSQKSARYIVDRFKYLDIIGIDSFAVDPSGSNSEVHRIFFEKDILPLETLFNLAELKSSLSSVNRIFELYCAPLKYLKSDAAQTRAFTMVN